MTVAINYFFCLVANMVCMYPIYVIPDYKCSRKKVVMALWIWMALGIARYMFDPQTTMATVLIIVDNIIFIIILGVTLAKPYFKMIIAFVIYGCIGYTGEILAGYLGYNLDCSIFEERFADVYIVQLVWDLVLAIVLYYVLKYWGNRINQFYVDAKFVVGLMLLHFFCVISPIYIDRIVIKNNTVANFEITIYMLTYVFVDVLGIILLVRTHLNQRKEYIQEQEAAYNREKERLKALVEENEYVAKLRHDYINQINVVRGLADEKPEEATDILGQMRKQYIEKLEK